MFQIMEEQHCKISQGYWTMFQLRGSGFTLALVLKILFTHTLGIYTHIIQNFEVELFILDSRKGYRVTTSFTVTCN